MIVKYLLPCLMVIIAFFLVLPLGMSFWVLNSITADVCGQVTQPEKRQIVSFLWWIINLSLVITVVVEFISPRAKVSAWVMFSFLIIGFLLACSIVANTNSAFLTECDIFMLPSHEIVEMNYYAVVAIVVVSLIRIQLKD